MLLLAVDTSGRDGGFALWRDGEIIASRAARAEKGFGAEVYLLIEELFSSAGVGYADLDGYAAAAGPGSFTGVRVGLTAVKAPAEVHGKRIVPVSNLEAMAWAGGGKLRAPVLDARRGEVYAALYDASLRAIEPETVGAWPEFLERVGARRVEFLSIEQGLFDRDGAAPLPPTDARPKSRIGRLVDAVAGLGAARFAEGHALKPEQVEANYIRRSDAERKAMNRERR